MKKHLSLLLGCSLLFVHLTWAQPEMFPPGTTVPPQYGMPPMAKGPGEYVWVESTNSLPTFDLVFRGGTPKDLVKAIEMATGKPLNTVIPAECANLQIPAVSVNKMTVAQLFEALIQASKTTERFTVIDPRDRSIGGNGSDVYVHDSTYGFKTVGLPAEGSIWYFYWDRGAERAPWQVLSSKVCKFYELEPYLDAGYTVEDITTAAKTGWQMLGIADTNRPEIAYHKDTKVLIAVGDEDKVNLIADVLKQLNTEKPNTNSQPGKTETK